MKKLFLNLLIISVLFGESNSLFEINPLKITKGFINNIINDEPQWVQNYKNGDMEYSDGDTLYFIGISSTIEKTKQKIAEQDSRSNALSQIASYINVDVNTNKSINKRSTQNSFEKDIEMETKTLSAVALDGIREQKIYTSNSKGKIIVYTFFKVSKLDLKEKKDKYEQESIKYKVLIDKLYNALEKNRINKAKDIVFKIEQFKRSIYDAVFHNLKKKLESAYEVSMDINKNDFKIGDYLKINIRPTKSLYVYILLKYKNDRKIKMIFPNRFDSNNFIKSQEFKKLKKVKISKEYTTKKGKTNKLVIYASSTPLPFKNYIDSSYKLSGNKNSSWEEMLQDRIFFKKEIDFLVQNKKTKKQKICVKLEGKGLVSNTLFEITKNSLRKHNFRVQRNCKNVPYKILLEYNESNNYDGMLEQTIRHISYSFYVSKDYEDIYSTDENKRKLSSKATASQIIKEIRSEFEENIMDLVFEIKENR